MGVIQSVYFTISDDQKMIVSYFFDPALEPGQYRISLSVSTDGGFTFFTPKSISGALGKIASTGRNSIEWDIFLDVDELVGDVQVKVSAEPHQPAFKRIFSSPVKKKRASRSLLERMFSASFEKKQITDGLGVFIGVPWISFPNDTYRSNVESEVVKHTFPHVSGGFTYIRMPSQINVSMSWVAFNIELHPEDDYSPHIHQAINLEWLFSPLPNIPSLTPFIGLGMNLSEIRGAHYTDLGSGISTSDIYCSGSILIKPSDYFILQISYKESIVRKYRKWNIFEMRLGFTI